MQKQRWDKVESILDTALTLHDEARTTYILSACSDDDDLLKEVHELLEAIEKSEQSNFLSTKTGSEEMLLEELSEISVGANEDFIGKQIGAFRVIEQVGFGGMGAVFKAERTKGNFSQQVAIKIVQAGLKAEDTIRRFEIERQILAAMHHPNIAALYDGGVTANGLPFLVMEYVDGVPVDQYCDQHKLTIKERLELFSDICSAVQYAHANLIIHRDLKAENIYVNSDGTVKILDFGIAKLLDPELSEMDLLETRPGQKFWTPAYAAPEQIIGKGITTATDVYALGVLLNKLLCGEFPIDMMEKSIREIEELIRNKEPLIPSNTALKSVNSSQISEKRQLTPAQLQQKLSGDLDAIVLKALRKEPDRRYGSVDQFMDDINRYLNGYPVHARPESASYRIKKFTGRNKALVFGTAAVFLIVIAATILSVSFAIETKQAEERALAQAAEAERQTEIANSVNLFLQQIIGQADPIINPAGKDLTLMEAVELANNLVEESFTDRPEVETAVRYTLGVVDMNLGRLNRAIDQLNLSLDLSLSTFGENHRQTMGVRSQLGLAHIRNGDLEKAENVLREGLDAAQKASAEDWKYSSMVLNHLGLVYLYRQDGASAEPFIRSSIDQKKEIAEGENSNIITAMHNLSGALMMQGKLDEATDIAHEVLEKRIQYYDGFHPEVAQSLNTVAYMLMQQDRHEEALPIRQQDLEMRQTLYDGDHPDLARAMHNMANLLNILERSEEALPLQKDAVAMWKRTLPETHIDIQRGLIILSRIYTSLGSHNDAIAIRQEHINLMKLSGNEGGSEQYSYLIEMVPNYLALADYEGAQRIVSEALSIYETPEGRTQWQYHSANNLMGEILFKQGLVEQSEKLISESAKAILEMKEGLDSALVNSVVERTNRVYETLGKPKLALE